MDAPAAPDWFTEPCPEGGTALSFKIKRKLHDERTPYQHLEVFETEAFGNLLALDGYVMLTARDNFIYHEMLTHPALFIHPAPRRVLIIGGGDCGSLHEVLKHREVESVDLVEIDERVTRAAERFFPELCATNDDPRAHLHFIDGIEWIQKAEPAGYDVIIVDSTDPSGQAARLFSEPFYRDCHKALDARGVLAAQSESPWLHRELIRSMHENMRAAGFDATRTLYFPQPAYPSGWWSASLAAKAVDLDVFRAEDAARRDFPTRYYNEAVHRGALAAPQFIKELG